MNNLDLDMYGRMIQKVVSVLKARFPNMTTEQTTEFAVLIVKEVVQEMMQS